MVHAGREDFWMRYATYLFALLWLAAFAHSQTYDQCQQSCSNAYNLCTGTADQQLNDCLATAASCQGGCEKGCPSGTPSSPRCPTDQQCYSDHDAAIATCNANYFDCSTSCGGEVPPSRAFRRHPGRPTKDAIWALLMRNLARPEKLKVPS